MMKDSIPLRAGSARGCDRPGKNDEERIMSNEQRGIPGKFEHLIL